MLKSRTLIKNKAFYDRSSDAPNAGMKHDPSETRSFSLILLLLIVHAVLVRLTLLHVLADGVS
jgi:hypothetical protein